MELCLKHLDGRPCEHRRGRRRGATCDRVHPENRPAATAEYKKKQTTVICQAFFCKGVCSDGAECLQLHLCAHPRGANDGEQTQTCTISPSVRAVSQLRGKILDAEKAIQSIRHTSPDGIKSQSFRHRWFAASRTKRKLDAKVREYLGGYEELLETLRNFAISHERLMGGHRRAPAGASAGTPAETSAGAPTGGSSRTGPPAGEDVRDATAPKDESTSYTDLYPSMRVVGRLRNAVRLSDRVQGDVLHLTRLLPGNRELQSRYYAALHTKRDLDDGIKAIHGKYDKLIETLQMLYTNVCGR